MNSLQPKGNLRTRQIKLLAAEDLEINSPPSRISTRKI